MVPEPNPVTNRALANSCKIPLQRNNLTTETESTYELQINFLIVAPQMVVQLNVLAMLVLTKIALV